jgi:tetratricopeptide (TPR) repeat protein
MRADQASFLAVIVCVIGGASAAAEGEVVVESQTVGTTLAARAPKPAETRERKPPFIPLVDGELLIYPRHPHYRSSYLRRHGFYPGLAPYEDQDYDFDPLYLETDFDRRRADRVLVLVGPKDSPNSTYYYYDAYPSYYRSGRYFPGTRVQGRYVTIQSPTVKAAEEASPEEEAAPEAAKEPQIAPGFGSGLSPILGGPPRVSLDFAAGELEFRRNDFVRAAEAFRRSVALNPDEGASKIALALALTGQEDYARAAHVLRRGLRSLADWGGLLPGVSHLYSSDRAEAVVLGRLEEAASKDAESGDLQLLLGFLRMARGEFDEAAERFRRAQAEDPLVVSLIEEARRRAQERSRAKTEAEDE